MFLPDILWGEVVQAYVCLGGPNRVGWAFGAQTSWAFSFILFLLSESSRTCGEAWCIVSAPGGPGRENGKCHPRRRP